MIKGPFITVLGTALALQAAAQHREAACFLFNDFEQEDALAGWETGPPVERRTPEGAGLGEFVPAWLVGTSEAANAEGYFPVIDGPAGNRFVMANDAAAPCNCDLSNATLTSPAINLSGRSGVSLELRVFHEGLLGSGPVLIETSLLQGQWTTLAEVEPVAGEWQHLSIDLGAFDGWPYFRVRFRWSDNGGWAGGIAIDDLCFRERLPHDLVVTQAQAGSSTASPFITGDQGLFYRQLPLTQAGALPVTARVKNGGTLPLQQIVLSAVLEQDGTQHGPYTSVPIDELLPGESREVTIATGWQPSDAGPVLIAVSGTSNTPDDATGDDQATGILQVTGPGWDLGYSAMACDAGPATGKVGGQGGFIASNRMEVLRTGDQAAGASVVYSTQTQAGAVVRAILMDASFNTLDTSVRRTLQQADVDAIWNGLPLYEAFSSAPLLSPGDYYVGIQQLTSNGDLPVYVATAGMAQAGRSVLQEGLAFTLGYLYSTPMIRLHLAEVPVGVAGRDDSPERMRIWPNPAHTTVQVDLDGKNGKGGWMITDAMGRMRREGTWQDQLSTLVLDVGDLPPGAYLLTVWSGSGRSTGRLAVVR